MAENPLSTRKSCSHIVLNFSPSWFSVNMGTGIISVLLYNSPHQFSGLKVIATIFYCLNCVLFLIFLLLTIARHIVYPFTLSKTLLHSAQSMFFGTLPMGLGTIVSATVLIMVPPYGRWAVNLAWSLWWIELILTVLSCFGIPFIMFNIHELQMDKMTAAWLLPIVPAVVTAASGGVLAIVLKPEEALITLIISYCFWGLGMGLSFLVIALYFHRLTIYKLPEAEFIVSAFLPLGPLGQGAYSLIQMAVASQKVFVQTNFLRGSSSAEIILIISIIMGLMLWGFGLWWLVHGASSVIVRYMKGRIPFNMGFWGFIFPLGVYTSATIILGKVLQSSFFSYLSIVFIILLVILWIIVAFGTIKRAVNGSIFVAPCLNTGCSRISPICEARIEMPQTL